MDRFVGYVRILFVTGTLVIFRSVSFPVSKAHPAKVELAVVALHVVATPILFYTYVAVGTVLRMSTDVVGRLAVVGTLGQPLLDYLAIGRGMIVHAATTNSSNVNNASIAQTKVTIPKAKNCLALATDGAFGL